MSGQEIEIDLSGIELLVLLSAKEIELLPFPKCQTIPLITLIF